MNTKISSRLYYPDPFQPTGIQFTLEDNAIVTVKVIDSTGNDVEILMNAQKCSAGEHVIQFKPAKYKNGKYWYQISVNIGERNLIDTKQIE